MNQLATFLTGIAIGQPQAYHNMQVYPLHIQNGHDRKYRTLDEAMNAKEVEIKEVSEGGRVPTLSVHNTGALPILLVVGEELVGAKQNRVLNTSLLVPATSDLEIPVSCVERGRWSYQSRGFTPSGTSSSHYSLRKAQTESVTARMLVNSDAHFAADQSAVWREVDRKISSHGTPSPTSALKDVYDQTSDQLKEYLDAFATPEAQGVLVAINGRIVGGDLFDHAETLRTLWPKLMRIYALDAVEHKTEAAEPTADAKQFLESAQNAKDETYDSVGLGKDVRLTSDQVTGSGLLWDDKLIHASLFSAQGMNA
ncbi:MAG: DUF6569 family protein [Chloroflexota bacterium]